MNYNIYDFIGNTGVAFIVASYFLLQIGKVTSTSLSFSIYNVIGAILILISLYDRFNLSAFIIEAFWLVISLIGIIRYFVKTGKQN